MKENRGAADKGLRHGRAEQQEVSEKTEKEKEVQAVEKRTKKGNEGLQFRGSEKFPITTAKFPTTSIGFSCGGSGGASRQRGRVKSGDLAAEYLERG